jgi:hypothetical protein
VVDENSRLMGTDEVATLEALTPKHAFVDVPREEIISAGAGGFLACIRHDGRIVRSGSVLLVWKLDFARD